MAARPVESSRPDELDEVTLERARRGDEAACRALVERYQRPVFALLGRLVGRESGGPGGAVEDLAQETFLRVFRQLGRFRPGGPAKPSTWILTIATRLAIDELRRAGRAPEAVELPVGLQTPAAAAPDVGAAARQLGEAVARAVRSLPPEHRAVFLLRAYHDLDYREIAEALDCDVGTVKSRLSRARARLRSALGDRHGT